MRKTPAAEPSLLDMEWPDPLVPMKVIAELAPWLMEENMLLAYAPPRLINIVSLVTSQENACRFCYGALRAGMRVSGYTDEQIRDLEREVELADGLTREVVKLARKLARSNPRPVKAELAALERQGLDPRAVAEIVYSIAMTCFSNRLGTFLALPPLRGLERLAETWFGRLVGQVLISAKGKRMRRTGPAAPAPAKGPLAPLISQLPESPLAAWYARLVESCLESPFLERRTKILMLAVVARTMGCRFCEEAARVDLESSGLTSEGFHRILATLSAPDLGQSDALILDWARETVHYDTGAIQKRTRALAEKVSPGVLLEAIGTAAVSNMAVRLAMLLE